MNKVGCVISRISSFCTALYAKKLRLRLLSSQDAEGELEIGEWGCARAWNGMEGLEGRMTGWMTAGGNNKATTESDDGWPWALGWDLP